MRRRRVTYRPSKSQAVFGGVVGIIFVCIGLFLVIPRLDCSVFCGPSSPPVSPV